MGAGCMCVKCVWVWVCRYVWVCVHVWVGVCVCVCVCVYVCVGVGVGVIDSAYCSRNKTNCGFRLQSMLMFDLERPKHYLSFLLFMTLWLLGHSIKIVSK